MDFNVRFPSCFFRKDPLRFEGYYNIKGRTCAYTTKYVCRRMDVHIYIYKRIYESILKYLYGLFRTRNIQNVRKIVCTTPPVLRTCGS